MENFRVDDAAGSPRLEFGLGVARGAGDRGSGVMVASSGGEGRLKVSAKVRRRAAEMLRE